MRTAIALAFVTVTGCAADPSPGSDTVDVYGSWTISFETPTCATKGVDLSFDVTSGAHVVSITDGFPFTSCNANGAIGATEYEFTCGGQASGAYFDLTIADGTSTDASATIHAWRYADGCATNPQTAIAATVIDRSE